MEQTFQKYVDNLTKEGFFDNLTKEQKEQKMKTARKYLKALFAEQQKGSEAYVEGKNVISHI